MQEEGLGVNNTRNCLKLTLARRLSN